ncbi:MAG: SUMF1/EgtB/PvdO family nonheme iron enzyme, partial [Candidatus Cloacimonadaceae bacterium]|nr:SUMF1/EgtB/PvdO family nonheme iron enzyme [Candidatus Cloacimonadaceae bacterium]
QGGTFQMGRTKGSGNADELPVRSVTLNDYYIGRYEVTQTEWSLVMHTTPAAFQDQLKPVENISWLDCIVYCNTRSLQEGLNPAYSYANQGTNPDNWNWANWTAAAADSISCNFSVNGYRLPTEAEWEFAAKGGNASTFSNVYSGCDFMDAVGWYLYNGGSSTHTPGKKAPNQAFLYDMTGNVWEWVWDRYGSYGSSAQSNPTGPATGEYRIRRGGSWMSTTGCGTASHRVKSLPELKTPFIGFRVVRSAV